MQSHLKPCTMKKFWGSQDNFESTLSRIREIWNYMPWGIPMSNRQLLLIIFFIIMISACSTEPKQVKKTISVAVKNTVTLADLGSLHCKPCLMMLPILDTLTNKYKGRVAVKFIDVNKHPNIARQLKIMTIPTQIIYDRHGQEVWRHVGFISQVDLEKKLLRFSKR